MLIKTSCRNAKALSCANVNDKLANPLKLMAYTVHAALLDSHEFVCKVFKHFAGWT